MANFDVDHALDSVRRGYGLPFAGSAMEIIPSCLRGAFRAPAGYHFVASDLSQIELRVLGWITNCAPMLQTFHDDLDLYIEFAARMYNCLYTEVTKAQRQIAKPAVLSCGYGTGGGEWKTEVKKCQRCKAAGCDECEDGYTYDQFKSGLWGYAESMGVKMSQEEAHEAVQTYRRVYSEVPTFWYTVEDQVRGMLRNRHTSAKWNRLVFQIVPGKLLRITLPSGRALNYLKPALDGSGNITFDTELSPSKVRGRRRLYGSLLTENLVQAIARDVMAVGMVRAHRAGFKICGHTHDELVTISPVDSRHNLTYLNNMMIGEISWCRDLPLKSEGWEGDVYRK